MELNLTVEQRSSSLVEASYSCPCGCHPTVSYERGTPASTDTCCCGNEFAVGDGALDRVTGRSGFETSVEPFQAPWGESLPAAWAIGASVHADGHGHGDQGEEDQGRLSHESSDRPIGGPVDPVCGMTVDPAAADRKGLHSSYQSKDYFFCGKGCKLDFDDDPERYLDPSYIPSM